MPRQIFKISKKTWLILIFFSFCVLLSKTGHSSDKASISLKEGWHNETMVHDKRLREFRYYVPNKAMPNAALVILLHGGTQNMMKLFKKHAGGSKEWVNLANQNGFILVTPNGTSPNNSHSDDKLNWNDCRHPETTTNRNVNADDVGFIKKLINWSNSQLNTNPKKVYVTGASNGGMMTYRIASELSNKVTATAAFIANLPEDSECELPKSPIPMMIMNGTKDKFMPWQGGEVKGKGGRVMSAKDTLEFWLLGNHSDKNKPIKKTYSNINKNDRSTVSSICYPPNSTSKIPSAMTCFYKVEGGGHVTPSIKHQTPKWIQRMVIGWQNRDIESAQVAWRFFEQF